MSDTLQAKLDNLPTRPGCYLMKTAEGAIIYVGKAINLRARVRSYFQQQALHTTKTRRLVSNIADLDWIIVETELEALVLENELIKRHQPRYNIRLKDDKTYPYIKIHWAEDYPKVTIVRRMARDGGRYFGPYTSAYNVRLTLEALRHIFPYLTCNRDITGKDERACLYFHIGRCNGPCIGAVNRDEYRAMVQGLADFLSGNTEPALTTLRGQMTDAAENWYFERAARLRDQIKAAEQLVERQKVVSGQQQDEDLIAFAQTNGDTCVQVFFVRHGKLIGRESFVLEGAEGDETDAVLSAFLTQFYSEAAYVPPEIVLPKDLDERLIIEQWLRSRRGGEKVVLTVPQEGQQRDLLEMAAQNAAETLHALRAQWQADKNKQVIALAELGHALGLADAPGRIECYDISTLQGTSTVGAMVVFAQGTPMKSDYRKFKIRGKGSLGAGEPDDFASMREMLRRRFRRAVEPPANEGAPGQAPRKGDQMWQRLPDLVVIDGGKGQLGVAVEVLREFDLFDQVPVIGLAKRFEDVYFPEQRDPLVLPRDSQALFLLQRIRDEAHRFGITFNRELRSKAGVMSELDKVPGIGPRRRKELLKRFGDLETIKQASIEELAAAPGMNVAAAEAIKDHFGD
ncbi:MAG: excinuclease ABC subunit UvrC [Anaerolineae bacterium]|nr:excinuclease ABC subunit UvrC [Anaerolineae bacterium]MBK9095714.1 excinuclease ABC subunit UvrC [Anaerolineae bacterium]